MHVCTIGYGVLLGADDHGGDGGGYDENEFSSSGPMNAQFPANANANAGGTMNMNASMNPHDEQQVGPTSGETLI